MRAELLSLWGLLFVADRIGLLELKVFGDSKTIIDWINEVVVLIVLELNYWCTRTKLLCFSFESFKCQHIYREHNKIVDGLSKEALKLPIAHLSL